MSRVPLSVLVAWTLLASVASARDVPRAKVTAVAGAAARARRVGRDTSEITVIARIRDLGMVAPACGHFASIGIHRYEVLAVLSGHYDHRDLFVAMPCPADLQSSAAGAAYRVGAVFQIDAARGPLAGSVFDAFSADPSPRYLLRGRPIAAEVP